MIDRTGSGPISLKIRSAFRKQWQPSRHLLFLIFNAGYLFVFFEPLSDLMHASWHSNYFSYIPFIPVITAYLLYRNRTRIFSHQEPSLEAGFAIATFGILLLVAGANRQSTLHPDDYRSFMACSAIAIWIAGFTVGYGIRAVRAALFPLLLLFLAVPLPTPLSERIIAFLQTGSAEAAFALFQLAGMPVVREGFVFHLPSLTVEVAEQWSGIRSFPALLIMGLLAGHFFLRTWMTRAVLAASLIPIAMIKNGVRIFALSAIGSYVDENIFSSPLHHGGGTVFFALALFLVGAVVVLLVRLEKRLPPKGGKCIF